MRFHDQTGGLKIFGLPLTEDFMEDGQTVQYLENARFEYHPELVGTDNAETLGQLGRQISHQRGWI